MDIPIRVVTADATPTAVVQAATTWSEFPRVWREFLDEVWAFVRDSGLEPGRNVMVYKDDVPRVEVGVEVSRTFVANGRVVPSSLPAGPAATAVAVGEPSPDLIAAAHAAVREWSAASGHQVTGVRWEIYSHWREDQDQTRFETQIYWQLKPATDMPLD